MKKQFKTHTIIPLAIYLIFLSGNVYADTNETKSELQESVQIEEVHLKPKENSFFSRASKIAEFLIDKDDDKDDVDETLDSNEEEFKLLDFIFNDEDNEDNFAEKILKSKIRRTDIPSFLLKEEMSFKFDNAPISQIQLYGGYRGALNSNFMPRNYSTDYDNMTLETGMYGKFKNPDYKFKIMFRPLPVHGTDYFESFLGDVYVVNTRIPHHQIIAGYSRVQNGFEGSVSSFILPFAQRSQIARYFGNARSLNVRMAGNYEYADYSLSYGSSGRYIANGMPGSEFTGQINIKPFGSKSEKYGKLTIGTGVNVGHNGGNYSVGNIYTGYKYKKFWSTAEAAIADGYNGSKGYSSNKASGYALTAGWKFNPHLQLIARVDDFDPDRHKAKNNRREYTAGINWFIRGQALKMLLNFVYCENRNQKDSCKLILGIQMML